MTGSDLRIVVLHTEVMSLVCNLLDECLDGPANELGGALLNLADLFVRLHDRLDALDWQLFAHSFLHL